MTTDPQLDGKTAVVTEATGGIGLAIARMLSSKGVDIVIPGRCEEILLAAAAAIRGIVRIIVADPATEEGAAILKREVPAADIFIDTSVVAGAKGRPASSKDDVTPLSICQAADANDLGLAGHYLRGMEARGWGRMVRISADGPASAAHSDVRCGLAMIDQQSQTGIPVGRGERLIVNALLAGRLEARERERLTRDAYANADVMMHEFAVARGAATSWCLHQTIDTAQIVGLIASLVSSSTTGFESAGPRRDIGVAEHPIRLFRETADKASGSRFEFGADDASQMH